MTAKDDTRTIGTKLLIEEIRRRGGAVTLEREGQRSWLYVTTRQGLVKARFSVRSKRDWQTKSTEGDDTAPDDPTRVWIFVDLPPENQARFYIAPEGAIKRDIAALYATYLDKNGGRRPVNPDSNHFGVLTEHVRRWLDRWDLLGLE